MYEPSIVLGLHWKRFSVAVVDNHRYFHGRTSVPRPVEGPPRHLRLIRIFPAAAPS